MKELQYKRRLLTNVMTSTSNCSYWLQVAFGFTLDTINYPANEFSHNITKSFEAVSKCLSDPLFMVVFCSTSALFAIFATSYFSKDESVQRAQKERIQGCLQELEEVCAGENNDPNPRDRKQRTCAQRYFDNNHQFVQYVISVGDGRSSFQNHRLLLRLEHDEIDLEALIDDFITFFNAGQETTANSLAFAFLELGKHPNAWKRLEEFQFKNSFS